ncbi:MAG TPA: hypothetical protein VGC91_20175 [Pyrinomonadaceae bacterium]
MRSSKFNLLLGLAVIVVAALACNSSFTTANISSLKISKDKSASSETSTFAPGDAVYVVAQISNTSDTHKVTSRVLFDDGADSGKPVPGTETTIDVPGAAAATFTFTPPASGWAAGKYKVEVTMKDDAGKQVDQKTGSFSVSG